MGVVQMGLIGGSSGLVSSVPVTNKTFTFKTTNYIFSKKGENDTFDCEKILVKLSIYCDLATVPAPINGAACIQKLFLTP